MTLLFKIITIFLLFITSILGLSCNSVFLTWSTMEVNMMLFLPLLALNKNFYFSNLLGMKYFFIQSLGSILLLVGVMTAVMVFEKNTIEPIMFFSLVWKSGLPPLHLWMISLMENLEQLSFIMLSTWQKILPFYMISIIPMEWLFIFIGFSMLVAIMMSLFQSNVKKMLIVSSIFMGGWIMSVMIFSKFYWLGVLFVYSIMFIGIVEVAFKFKMVKKFSTVLKTNTLMEKFVLFIMSLAMAGFPPMVGFFLKMMILMSLFSQELLFLSMILIFSSIVVMFMYSTMFFFSLSLYNLSESMGSSYQPSKIYILLPVFVYGLMPMMAVF